MNKILEQNFQESYLKRSKKSLRIIVLLIGVFFFVFFTYDLFANKSVPNITILLLCRIIFLLFSIFIYFKTDYFLKSHPYLRITTYEFILVLVYYIIVFNHENPHFLIQTLGVNIIVLIIYFLVPNILSNKMILSLLTLISFITISNIRYHPTYLEITSVVVYLLLTIILGCFSSYNLGKYQRLDFVNKQYFIELSTKDPLMNIYNRMKFNQALSKEIEFARRYEKTFSLIMFDIDHFKQINDGNGHIFGDKILIGISQLVKESIREVDLFARWGGEEFVILLPQTDCKEAFLLAERLRKLIQEKSMINNLALTCSFGVTSFLKEDNEDSIMDRVDMTLYKAKETGRNITVTQ